MRTEREREVSSAAASHPFVMLPITTARARSSLCPKHTSRSHAICLADDSLKCGAVPGVAKVAMYVVATPDRC